MCFIATAVYGSLDHPDVVSLRRFRDEFLMKIALGRIFVDIYYDYAPYAADVVVQYPMASKFVKLMLWMAIRVTRILHADILVALLQ